MAEVLRLTVEVSGLQSRLDQVREEANRDIEFPLSGAGTGADEDPFAFDTSVSGTECTVSAGAVCNNASGGAAGVAEQTLELVGNPVWVYIRYAWSQMDSPTVEQLSTRPTSNPTYLQVPLAEYAASGDTFTLVQRCHRGDIHY